MIITPDAAYNPVNQSIITPRTRLAPGITMGRFLGGYGDKQTMSHIIDETQRLKLAKQYYLQAQVIIDFVHKIDRHSKEQMMKEFPEFSDRKKALFENKAKKYNEHYKTLETLANN